MAGGTGRRIGSLLFSAPVGDATFALRPAFNSGQASQAGETIWNNWWFGSGGIVPLVVHHRKMQGAQ